MTTQNPHIEDGSLRFLMSRSGEPLDEFEGEDQVKVAYADPGSDTYVSVSGVAEIVEDRAKKLALWNKGAEAWFKGGVNDPDLALVRVRIEHADYWDVKENKLVQLVKIAKAAMSGQPPKLGEQGHVRPPGSPRRRSDEHAPRHLDALRVDPAVGLDQQRGDGVADVVGQAGA